MHFPGSLYGKVTKFDRKLNFLTSFAVRVKHGPKWHGTAEHFFQTERLGTELNVVVKPFPSFAQFEFDRKMGTIGALLYNVALAIQTQPLRPDRQSTEQLNALHDFVTREVGVLMNQVSLQRVVIFSEYTLDVDQRRTPRTKHELV